MKTFKDARHFINRKRKPDVIKKVSRGVVDARAILNSKLGQKSALRTSSSQRFPSFSRNERSTSSDTQKKHVKVSKDGNIVITAKSEDAQKKVAARPRWSPPDVETADVEHLSIDDVLDMDALPSAPLMQKRLPTCERILDDAVMQNTMVADQISAQQTVRVFVSNLHPSVSKLDVIELFGDVGLIKHAEMPQPGVAVIEYFDPNDAVKASEFYHQRLLDGMPMVCQVQSQAPKRSLISQRLGENLLSKNPGVIHNPRNVRFTVKLT